MINFTRFLRRFGYCYFSKGLTAIPLKPGKDLHMNVEVRPKNPIGEGDPTRIAITIDSPSAEYWGKDTEAELLLVFDSTATVRPHSQTVYLQKNEPTTPVYFELTAPDSQTERYLLSVYLVAPARQVTLLSQFPGAITSARPSKTRARQ